MKNHVNSKLRRARKEYFQHLPFKESPTPQAFWKNVKVLMPSINVRQHHDQLSGRHCSDPVTLAYAFNDYFVSIGPMLEVWIDPLMFKPMDRNICL